MTQRPALPRSPIDGAEATVRSEVARPTDSETRNDRCPSTLEGRAPFARLLADVTQHLGISVRPNWSEVHLAHLPANFAMTHLDVVGTSDHEALSPRRSQ